VFRNFENEIITNLSYHFPHHNSNSIFGRIKIFITHKFLSNQAQISHHDDTDKCQGFTHILQTELTKSGKFLMHNCQPVLITPSFTEIDQYPSNCQYHADI